MEQRKNFRSIHSKLRNQMKPAEVQEKSEAICGKLLQSEWYADAKTIYAFYPLGQEVDCRSFLLQAMADGKQIALPRTSKDYSMEFYEIHAFDDLEEGSFHVMEPKAHCKNIQVMDAVAIIPGLVFDLEGNRYGYGKGYYDRYLERFPKVKRYAVAYAHQLEPQIPVLDTDIKMHRLYTEEDAFIF